MIPVRGEANHLSCNVFVRFKPRGIDWITEQVKLAQPPEVSMERLSLYNPELENKAYGASCRNE